MTLPLIGGKVWSKISARGWARARTEWYLSSAISSPRSSSRWPAMKIGGSLRHFEHLPFEFGV